MRDIADAVARQAGQTGVRLRVGTVTAVTSAQVTVRLADATVSQAMWCDHVTGLRSGDVVAVLHAPPVVLIIGRPTATGQSPVINHDFEDQAAGATPANWSRYDAAGTATITTTGSGAYSGQHAVSVGASAFTDSYIYSVPIPVQPGDVWRLTAYASGVYGGQPRTAGGVLGAMWFASAGGLYPGTVAPDSIAAQEAAVVESQWTELAGQVTVPAGASYMAVYLETLTASSGSSALLWDLVDARKLT